MPDSIDSPREPGARTDEVADVSIEELGPSQSLPATAIALRGPAAAPFTDALGVSVVETTKAAKRMRTVYRLVPRQELQQGLDAGTLRMATPRKGGDVSVLIKEAETGRIAGHADLKSARPNVMKALGPVAWQAMAMATQQHFLVEINDKLAAIEGRVDELLARDTDAKLAELHELREEAQRARAALARGTPPTEAELRQWLHRAGVIRKEVARRAERASRKYLTAEASAEEAEEAFALAAAAVQVLAELSAVYGALPVDSADELQHRLDVEHGRVEPAREALRAIAATLDVAHHRWEMHHTIYERERPKARLVQGLNKVSPKKLGAPAPQGDPLTEEAARRAAAVLALSHPRAESLLLEVASDGEVRVAVEEATAPPPADDDALTEDAIERAVTQYGGAWWTLGTYGPYASREAAVARLRSLGPMARS